MQNETLYRCLQPACARTWPRRVNFCPYCGTPQQAEVARGDAAAHGLPPAAQAASPAAAAPGILLGKGNGDRAADVPKAAPAPAAAAAAAGAEVPAREAQGRPAASAAATPSAPAATPGPGVRPAAPPLSSLPPLPPLPPPPRPGVRAGAAPRAAPAPDAPLPPKRQPVRLRWWLLALAVLWAVWLVANPGKRRIEKQMDKAIALATACKPNEAQSELIALRSTRATPEQLQKVQQALNEAAGACTRKRQRDKAWREAKASVESALAASSVERARSRLRAFTKRWGEDAASRDLKEKIDARQPEHPRADELR